MKKIIYGSLILFGMISLANAQTTTQAPQTTKQEQRKEAKELQGAAKFDMALGALENRNFVLEKHEPRSTSKSRICYNFIQVEGDKIFEQSVQVPRAANVNTGGSFRQGEGIIKTLTLTPDKKGNIKVRLEADMTSIESITQHKWPLKLNFKLFKNSNSAPQIGGWEGYIVLPSQSNTVRLNGVMPEAVPQGFIRPNRR